ncbi:MAG: hypothetical protein U0K83_03115, partial [Bacteroidales bacterium]|nr:hypothetical protein [Bacteroidales bacterium]
MIRRIICLILFCLVLSPLSAQVLSYPDSSVLASGNWYAINIPTSGIYKLTKADFVSLGVPEQEINFDNLSIFGRGGAAISDINAEYQYSDLREKSIYVNKTGNPYALFYANGTLSIDYDAASESLDFETHAYSDVSTYFICFNPEIGEKKRVTARQTVESLATLEKTSESDLFVHKRELINFLGSGRLWVGESFSTLSNEVSLPMYLQNVDTQEPVKMTVSVYNQSEVYSVFSFSVNNNTVGSINALKTPVDYAASSKIESFSFNVSGENNNLKIIFNGQGTAKGRLGYVKTEYIKNLRYNNSFLQFYTCSAVGNDDVVSYTVNNVKNNAFTIWEIDGEETALVEDYTKEGESVSLKVEADNLRKIVVFSGSNFPTPILKGKIENQNLHAWKATDFVIVTAPIFLDQAEELAELHRQYDGASLEKVHTRKVSVPKAKKTDISGQTRKKSFTTEVVKICIAIMVICGVTCVILKGLANKAEYT